MSKESWRLTVEKDGLQDSLLILGQRILETNCRKRWSEKVSLWEKAGVASARICTNQSQYPSIQEREWNWYLKNCSDGQSIPENY